MAPILDPRQASRTPFSSAEDGPTPLGWARLVRTIPQRRTEAGQGARTQEAPHQETHSPGPRVPCAAGRPPPGVHRNTRPGLAVGLLCAHGRSARRPRSRRCSPERPTGCGPHPPARVLGAPTVRRANTSRCMALWRRPRRSDRWWEGRPRRLATERRSPAARRCHRPKTHTNRNSAAQDRPLDHTCRLQNTWGSRGGTWCRRRLSGPFPPPVTAGHAVWRRESPTRRGRPPPTRRAPRRDRPRSGERRAGASGRSPDPPPHHRPRTG